MDAVEFRQALDAAVDIPGLVYIRGHRGDTPELLDATEYQFTTGSTYHLKRGSDIGVVSTGHATQWVLEASALLDQQGVSHSILHVPTLKPVNEKEIADFCFAHNQIVTVENHQIVTGLGSLVAEITGDIGGGPRIKRIGIPNQWAPGGTLKYIRQQLQLDAEGLAQQIQEAANG
jgi:transketolase